MGSYYELGRFNLTQEELGYLSAFKTALAVAAPWAGAMALARLPRRATLLLAAGWEDGTVLVAGDAGLSPSFGVLSPGVGNQGGDGVAYAEHVSGSKHMIHMGLMAAVAAGFGVYQLYQFDLSDGRMPHYRRAYHN